MIDRKITNNYVYKLLLNCRVRYLNKVKYNNNKWNLVEAHRYMIYIRDTIREVIRHLEM